MAPTKRSASSARQADDRGPLWWGYRQRNKLTALTSVPQLAEALYLARQQRSTGCLKVLAAGRESELLLEGGNLVGADVRCGYRTPAQALLLAGLLDSGTVDALWARGERAAPGRETLEACGLDSRRALEVHALGHVEKLSAIAESVFFQEGEVRPSFQPIPGTRIVRAAWRLRSPEPAPNFVFRCLDPARCEPWLQSDDERDFLRGFESFKKAAGASPSQLALLELLRREGSVECLEAAPSQPGQEEISWADLLTDEPPTGAAPAGEPVPAAKPVPLQRPAEAEVMRAARAQDESIHEMNEALRRSAAAAEPDWLTRDEASVDQPMIELSPIEANQPSSVRIAPTVEPPPSLWQTSPPVLTEAQFYGPRPDAPSAQSNEPSIAQDSSASFEEALRCVDENVGELIGLSSSAPKLSTPDSIGVTAEEPPAADRMAKAPRVSPLPVLEENRLATEEVTSAGVLLDEDTWLLEEEDLGSDPSDSARARRQRLLWRSMENLGAPGARPSERPSAVGVEPDRLDEPAQPVENAAAPSSGDKALAEEIESRYQRLQAHPNHFAVLGLPVSASVDQVKAAFLELAKVFHPDRLPASLHYLSAKVKAIFEAVRQAYETLHSEPRRGLYIASLTTAQAPKSASPKEGAEEAFKRGESLMRKRDYVGAEWEFQTAFDLDAKASYLALAAWALYLDPARRQEAARAKQMMADALRRDPDCGPAHYQLGVIARVEGNMDHAEGHFREAVRIMPKHPEANQELRLIEMRKKKDPIRRLFRRRSDE